MKKYDVTYKSKVITKNSYLKADGYSSVTFRNTGDEAITIMNNITLAVDSSDLHFINRPNEIIRNDFFIQFAGTGSDPQILVIMTYYQEVK